MGNGLSEALTAFAMPMTILAHVGILIIKCMASFATGFSLISRWWGIAEQDVLSRTQGL